MAQINASLFRRGNRASMFRAIRHIELYMEMRHAHRRSVFRYPVYVELLRLCDRAALRASARLEHDGVTPSR